MRFLLNIFVVLLLAACSFASSDSELESTLLEFESLENPSNLSDLSKGALQLLDNTESDFNGKTSRFDILKKVQLLERLTTQQAFEVGLEYKPLNKFSTYHDDDISVSMMSLETNVLKPFDIDGSKLFFGNLYLPYLEGVIYPEVQVQKLGAFSVGTLRNMLRKYPQFRVENFKVGPNNLIDVVRYTDDSKSCKKSKTIVFGENLNLSFFSPCEVFDINSTYISFKNDSRFLIQEFIRQLKFGDINNLDSELSIQSVSGDVEKLNSLIVDTFVSVVNVSKVSINKFKVVLEAPVKDTDSFHFIDFDVEINSLGNVFVSNVITSSDFLIFNTGVDGLQIKRNLDLIDIRLDREAIMFLCEDMPRCDLEMANFQRIKDNVISFRYSSGVQNLRSVFYNTRLNKKYDLFGVYDSYHNDKLYFCNSEGLGKMGLKVLDINSFELLDIVEEESDDIIVSCRGLNKHTKKFEYEVVNTSQMEKFYMGDDSVVSVLQVL